MNTHPNDSIIDALPAALVAHVDALRATTPDAVASDEAQARLTTRLAHVRPFRPQARRRAVWFGATGIAALLALVVVPALLMRPSPAFAQIQEHFRDFRTLRMVFETRVADAMSTHTTVEMDRDGRVRVDVDRGLSVIVDPAAGRSVQLIHDARMAMVTPIPVGGRPDDSLAWLDELRAFTGRATQLPEVRTIDGALAHGYRVDFDGMTLTLWATDDGMPLAMDLVQGGLATQTFRFTFDAPIDPARFATTIPPGYTLAGDGTDG